MDGPTYKQTIGHARILKGACLIGILAVILFSNCASQVDGTQYVIEPKNRYLSSSELYISTSSNLEALVLENLAIARETIIMQTDTVPPLSIIQGSQKAQTRGIQVGVLFNSSLTDTSDMLKSAGIFLYLDTLNDLEINDIAVIDGETVLIGSFLSGEGKVDSLRIIRNEYDSTLHTAFWLKHVGHSLLIFDRLKRRSTNE